MSKNFLGLDSDYEFLIRLNPRLVNGLRRLDSSFEIDSRIRKAIEIKLRREDIPNLATFLETVHSAIQGKRKRSYFIRLVDPENPSVSFSTTPLLHNALYMASLQVAPDQVPRARFNCFLFSRTLSAKLQPYLTSVEEKEILDVFLRVHTYDAGAADSGLFDSPAAPDAPATPAAFAAYKGALKAEDLSGAMLSPDRTDAMSANYRQLLVREDIVEEVRLAQVVLRLLRDNPEHPVAQCYECPLCRGHASQAEGRRAMLQGSDSILRAPPLPKAGLQ